MNIGIVGLGLIGGSLGLKLQKLNHTVYGITNNTINKQRAEKRNLANHISCDLSYLKKCSLIILALPIRQLLSPTRELIEAIPQESVITDVGSIKEPIVEKWENIHPLFVGSHPMAGTEQKGVESGFENLFNNTNWVITSTTRTNLKSKELLTELIDSMQCEIYEISPKEHDIAVSLISHLPIFLSTCLIETAKDNQNKSLLEISHKLASSGFADTTRVGGGNPDLGLDLAIHNRENILNALALLRNKIATTEDLIKEKNWEDLFRKLDNNKKAREDFI